MSFLPQLIQSVILLLGFCLKLYCCDPKTKKQQKPNNVTAPSANKDNASVTGDKGTNAEKKQTPSHNAATVSAPKRPPPHLQQVKTKKDNKDNTES